MNNILRKLKYVLTKSIPKEPYKMVLIVRNDILMGRGKTASQCAHAAVECVNRCSSGINKEILDTWLILGQPKIVLRISGEENLKTLASNAKSQRLIAVIIRDAGKTQLEPGTVSVLGIGPGSNKTIDALTSHLKLL